MLIYEGEKLELYKRENLKIDPSWNERNFTFQVKQYFNTSIEKVLAISGLRGTGKTVGILQAAKDLDPIYILAQKEDEATGRDYINFIKNSNKKYIIIDEYSWIKDRKALDYYLITAIQNGKRIVITGTESIVLNYLNYSTLNHRVDVVHTTIFPYDEYRRVYNLSNNQKVCDNYLIEGGLFREYIINDYLSMRDYIQNAVIDNLSSYLKKELTIEKAETITYSIFFKAICPSNLSSVPVLRDSRGLLANFLYTMGIDTNSNIKEYDLHRVADIFEKTGIIVRIPNFDQYSTIKERYYITNPSLTSQLIKVAYDIPTLDDATLGRIFEGCAMVQLATNKISEHEIFFIDSQGQKNLPSKELDIVIIDKEREHVYFFKCKHSQSHKIKTNATILSGYIEENNFQDADIDGRYIIYNGPLLVKKYDVGNIIFTPLNDIIDNYFSFNEHVKNNKNKINNIDINKHEKPTKTSIVNIIDLVRNEAKENGKYISDTIINERQKFVELLQTKEKQDEPSSKKTQSPII